MANAAAPANVADMPTDAISGGGFKGVALRDVATGNYVKSLSQPGNGQNANYSLSGADLAPFANDGRTYTLDFLDYDHGGWGWVGLDNVTIPGSLMMIDLAVASTTIFAGGSTTLQVTIPLGYNATAADTVYVTNSNPAAITLNGSGATEVTVTFAAGGPPSQDVTVGTAGLGNLSWSLRSNIYRLVQGKERLVGMRARGMKAVAKNS